MSRKHEVIKHFVRFYSPGTLTAETTIKPINKWDKSKAIQMSKEIKERHGALPYRFCFFCRGRKTGDLDSDMIATSRMYYLGGIVKTLEEIKSEKDRKNRILISNMEGNKWNKIVINNNSYTWTQPLKDKDEVLNIGD